MIMAADSALLAPLVGYWLRWIAPQALHSAGCLAASAFSPLHYSAAFQSAAYAGALF